MSEPRTPKKLGLSEWILVGIVGGIAAGLVFGEWCARLSVLGDAFVGLLQMTVVPYVIAALIGGIAKLTPRQSRLLLGRFALVILGLWTLAFVVIFAVSFAYPPQTSGAFFSSSLIEPPASFDFLGLFVPANPFRSLVENKIPAVVLFCLLAGAALMGMREKARAIELLDLVAETMSRVTGYVVAASPFGVFFISAAAAGTMRMEDLGRLQGYVLTSTLAVVGLAFGVLPVLVKIMTPLRYRDIAPLLKSAVVLAFATGKTMVVLPMLIEGLKKIFEERDLGGEESASMIEVLVPLGFSFPHMGRLLATIFVPFAAWYVGKPLELSQWPVLVGAGFFSHFSSATISIPFQLDLMRIPADMFQLFMVTGVYVGRLGDAIGAAYLLALTALGACAVLGKLSVDGKRLGIAGLVTLALTVVSVGSLRAYLSWAGGGDRDQSHLIASLLPLEEQVDATVVESVPNPDPLLDGESHLARIERRGLLRVCFLPDDLPFSFLDPEGQPIGFDIDLVHDLAHDLGPVGLELVSIGDDSISDLFARDVCDLGVGGFLGTTELSRRTRFSDPYLEVHMALVVADHRDREFRSIDSLRRLDDLRVGVLSDGWFKESLGRYVPSVETRRLTSPRQFFEPAGGDPPLDALLHTAEAGAAWTLLYPAYQVATPFPDQVELPVVFPYAGNEDGPMDELLDHWVVLKANDGTIERLFEHWILGRGAVDTSPRWSVVRDVLHWTDR